jgi:hypothetical protein
MSASSHNGNARGLAIAAKQSEMEIPDPSKEANRYDPGRPY